MSAFSDSELAYLTEPGGRRLGRLATVGADGTPHGVPVGFRYDPEQDAIVVRGYALKRSKKFRDVGRSGRAAIVVDDIASVDPWHVRGVEVRGRGEAIDGDRPMIRIRPERVRSWGLAEP